MNSIKWIARFLEDRNLEKPTGRPLYTYRCNDEEYRSLQRWLNFTIPLALMSNSRTEVLPPLFCLYAAESWRRNHAGGPWQWKTILADLQAEDTPYPRLTDWTRDGLNYWGRKLLRVGGGTGYLVTLACEGGLPLRLLHHQGNKLRQYFKELLTEYQREQLRGLDARLLAERLADRLPVSLRQNEVYNLGGELVEAIWQLQKEVQDSPRPLDDLDERQPGWRETLPLRLDDQQAQALLNNLMAQAVELGRRPPVAFRWQHHLRPTANGWRLEKGLSLPSSLDADQLRALSNRGHDLPPGPRFRLLATPHQGVPTPIALGTRIQGREGNSYRIERLHREDVLYRNREAADEHRVLLRDGERLLELDRLPGGRTLSELPWVFVGDPGQDLVLAGEGAVRTRREQAWVLADEAVEAVALEQSRCEPLPGSPLPRRVLYRVDGQVRFVDPVNGATTVRCAQTEDSSEAFCLGGDRLPVDGEEVFVGPPTLRRLNPDGSLHALPEVQLQWRPVHRLQGWRTDMHHCLGEVVIRYLEGDEVRFSQRTRVLPRGCRVTFQPLGRNQGRVLLEGLGAVQLRAPQQAGLTLAIEHPSEGYRIDCRAEGDPVPGSFQVYLWWDADLRHDQRQLNLRLPFPALGGRFINPDGQTLPANCRIPLSRLSGVRAEAMAVSGGGLFELEGELLADDLDGELKKLLWLRRRLPTEGNRCELDLGIVEEDLERMFSVTDHLDAYVRLIINGRSGPSAPLRVCRFDLPLLPDREQGWIVLDDAGQARLGEQGLDDSQIEMLPLGDPYAEPVVLTRVAQQAAWQVPADLSPGPWLTVGREGLWPRFRPLRWFVAPEPCGESEPTAPPDTLPPPQTLAEVVSLAFADQRRQAFMTIFDRMARRPDDDQWPVLFQYLEVYRDLPPATLDLLRCLGGHPAALVMALLLAGERHFDRVWSLADRLPFSWFLIPLPLWREGARAQVDHLRQALEFMGVEKEKWVWQTMNGFFVQTALHQPYQTVIAEWLQGELSLERSRQQSLLQLAASAPGQQVLLSLRNDPRQELLNGRADDQWPQGIRALEALDDRLPEPLEGLRDHLTDYRAGVLNGPLTAALISAWQIPHNPAVLYELRQIRLFAPGYFDTVYAIALSLAIHLSHSLSK